MYYDDSYEQPNHNGYVPYAHGEFMPPMQDVRNDADYWYRAISMEEAIQIARRQVPGQVVSAELDRRGNRLIYEVEIIADSNNVKYEVKIDYNTGQVIEVEID